MMLKIYQPRTTLNDMTQSEVDSLTSKAEMLRTRFKIIHTELQMMMSDDEYENGLLKSYDMTTLLIIKSLSNF